ncbi:MAG TPA: hypothetical protein VGL82_11210 [Bryobacteraceae bacterium]|jgi:hypothetical protein
MKRSRQAGLVVLLCAAAVVLALAAGEIFLRMRTPARVAIPFYNHISPYVMFRPQESASYVTAEKFDMSHKKRGVTHFTNEDGLRVPAAGYQIARPCGGTTARGGAGRVGGAVGKYLGRHAAGIAARRDAQRDARAGHRSDQWRDCFGGLAAVRGAAGFDSRAVSAGRGDSLRRIQRFVSAHHI